LAERGRASSFVRAIVAAILLAHIAWIGMTSLLLISYRFSHPSVTVLMAYRAWTDGWKILPPRPLALRSVPAWLRAMLISVEDHKFYSHFGLDFEAVQRAWEINSHLSEPLHGGSTLTMQVARTLFLIPEKSYLRKYLEVIAALELECLLGKDRILELYFGYAEWGKGIFGVEAASRRYWGKGVRSLSHEEGARLIALLSSPIKYQPDNFGRSLILRERYAFLMKRYALEGPPRVGEDGSMPPAETSTNETAPNETLPTIAAPSESPIPDAPPEVAQPSEAVQ
jgi:monofunctional biosynthetic peptidoglycan transglycosylase